MTRAFTYGLTGNTATDDRAAAADRTYSYDSSDRLVSVADGGVTLATYLHNPGGQRIAKTVGAATTHYLYDLGGNPIAEADGTTGTAQAEYVWLGGMPLAYITGGAVYYVHTDHLTTPQRLTAADGTVAWDASYSPFGEATVTGGLTFNLRFPGQYLDAETGLHYNGFRDYDPTTGRYIQSDPIGLGGGLNTYGYVGGNPVMGVDYLGLECVAVNDTVTCNVPGEELTIAFPRPKEWPDQLNSNSPNYHIYNTPVDLQGVDPACVLQGIIDDPTPGKPSPAKDSGTSNNATPNLIQDLFNILDYVSSFGNDAGGYNNSPVVSYLTNNGTVVVNVSQPGHRLHPGYVARYVGDSYVNNFGEGTARLQGPVSKKMGVADWINGVWNEQTQAIIDQCKCNAQ